MRFWALTFLIAINLAASPAYAQDLSILPSRSHCDQAGMVGNENAKACVTSSGAIQAQPLTRPDCLKARMTWSDTANVCATEVATMLNSEQVATISQPLTRSDCNTAGMTWNANANVCGTAGPDTEAASNGTGPAASTILINIDKAKQRMTVFLDGVDRYEWPVSTGMPGYSTPSGTYTASSMNKIWYSKQWDNAPMPHAVFFTKEGHAIHGTNEVRRLGKPASHGCVRISPKNAATLYALVEENGLDNTEVVLVGLTPGGEGQVASREVSKPRYSRAAPQVRTYQRRGRFFRRLFGAR